MTKYIRVKEKYCGFISVQYISIIASCVTLAMQLAFSIFFLIYGQLWGLIPLGLTIASHLFFIVTISQFKSTISISIYTSIEIAFAFTILGFAIWILSWILYPSRSFIYTFCTNILQNNSCATQTQLFSLIWGALFIIFFFVSVILLPIYKSTWRNIKATRKSSSVYIDKDNSTAPVQPIFNINTVPQSPLPAQIILQPQQTGPQTSSSILTPVGTLQLNLYSVQLPNGGTVLSHTPFVDYDNFSQTGQAILERL